MSRRFPRSELKYTYEIIVWAKLPAPDCWESFTCLCGRVRNILQGFVEGNPLNFESYRPIEKTVPAAKVVISMLNLPLDFDIEKILMMSQSNLEYVRMRKCHPRSILLVCRIPSEEKMLYSDDSEFFLIKIQYTIFCVINTTSMKMPVLSQWNFKSVIFRNPECDFLVHPTQRLSRQIYVVPKLMVRIVMHFGQSFTRDEEALGDTIK